MTLSGTGLRMLLLFIRAVQAVGGTVAGAGVPQELRDIAAAAGFLELFQQAPSVVPPVMPSPPPVARIDIYPTHHHAGFALRPGFPLPFGATVLARGVNFAVYSRHATACTLVLFEPGVGEPVAEIPFPPEFRIGDVFAMTVFDLDPDDLEYGFRMDGPYVPEAGHRFDKAKFLLDPMARAVSGRDVWGGPAGPIAPVPLPRPDHPAGLRLGRRPAARAAHRGPRHLRDARPRLHAQPDFRRQVSRHFCRAAREDPVPEGARRQLRRAAADLRVRRAGERPDATRSPASRLCNYWGYNTVGFFAPKAGYAATGQVGMQADEFKALVKELHRNGIEVILDVVFNHTAEGNEHGPTISFRGLDNRTYYMLTPDGHYYNFSGCGNTLNCNHPVVRDFVLELPAPLGGGIPHRRLPLRPGQHPRPRRRRHTAAPTRRCWRRWPLDPVLGKTKLIAEAWDAGGLYQVGTFPAYGRWAEWNGQYRDCVRKFLKGDMGQVGEMAHAPAGLAGPVPRPRPYRVDQLRHLSRRLHARRPGQLQREAQRGQRRGEPRRRQRQPLMELRRRGADGRPGRSLALRRRQMKNALAMLLLSQGVPMLLMGDECRPHAAGQ